MESQPQRTARLLASSLIGLLRPSLLGCLLAYYWLIHIDILDDTINSVKNVLFLKYFINRYCLFNEILDSLACIIDIHAALCLFNVI